MMKHVISKRFAVVVMRRILSSVEKGFAVALLVVALVFCWNSSWADTLKGSAIYRERTVLPPGSVFEAELLEISRADAPATVLGRCRLDPAGMPPFRFEIAYNAASVHPAQRYTVRATIRHKGDLLFTTDRIYPVLKGSNEPLQQLLVAAGKRTPVSLSGEIGSLPASFEGSLPGRKNPVLWHVDLLPEGRFQLRQTYIEPAGPKSYDDIGRWKREQDTGRIKLLGGREAPIFLLPKDNGAAMEKLDLHGRPSFSKPENKLHRLPVQQLIEPQMFLQGIFVSMADAASMTLCVDGQRLPVATEEDYPALERAYRKSVSKAGEPIMVSLEGMIAMRPSMEQNLPERKTLVVKKFIAVRPGTNCPKR